LLPHLLHSLAAGGIFADFGLQNDTTYLNDKHALKSNSHRRINQHDYAD